MFMGSITYKKKKKVLVGIRNKIAGNLKENRKKKKKKNRKKKKEQMAGQFSFTLFGKGHCPSQYAL